ncbi:Ig-like domain-containing protein [Agaribacterium sp. ZY112]|uniref:Ig-like domain-containing protein n=1 Tax=Agaribacterium sp. ZY112 TaxID=3233574 RepID=UPI00352418C9
MYKLTRLSHAVGLASAVFAGGLSTTTLANVKVDINANVLHSVNGISNFGRERRIMIHATPIENEFLGEKEKLDYLMELGVSFGRDTGTPTWYFKQTQGDYTREDNGPEIFPWGHAGNHDPEQFQQAAGAYHWALDNKFADHQEYFDRAPAMIMGSQPKPSFPNWSAYSWFGGGLDTESPWRPRTMEQAAEWYADFLEQMYLREEGNPNRLAMPKYWEVVNEPDMLMNVPGHEGHVSTWEELFRYHNVVADVVRERLGDDAPLIGGMTWGLHDLQNGDKTATGAPRRQGDALLSAFYGNDEGSTLIKDAITNGIFAESESMADSNTNRQWYQWDVIWKGFMDTAGQNMDFYSIHTYDWPRWPQENGGVRRTGVHTEGVLDQLEWYDMKMLGQRKPVIVSEYGTVSGRFQTQGTTLDRHRMRWEALKPFSQQMMQFMERPDYVTASLPFIVVKGTWGDAGKTAPYSQSLLDRDYDSCEETAEAYENCTWNFNASIHWYELWRDVEGERVDTYSSDRDIQVDAYVNNNDMNAENHMYVIVNSLHGEETSVDLSWAGIDGNDINSITLRHLYLDETLDADGDVSNGIGKPILAEAELASLPTELTVGADATFILDIEYANPIDLSQSSNETKYAAEPLAAAEPYRVTRSATPLSIQINGVDKPVTGEAQLRVTGGFFLANAFKGTEQDRRVKLTVNGNEVDVNADWRGENFYTNRLMLTMELPFPAEYLADDGNNTFELFTLASGDYSAAMLQVWDQSTDLNRSVVTAPSGDAVTGLSLAETGTMNMKVTESVALTAQIAPETAADKSITWSSSDSSVVSVDPNGLVTATGLGTAIVTAESVDGSFVADVDFDVSALVPTSVGMSGVPAELNIGASKQLTAAVRPIHAQNRAVTWSSSDESIATVSASGLVEAVGAGNVTITATTVEGELSARASIEVTSLALDAITITPEFTVLPIADVFPLSVAFTPANASDTSVVWSSSNTNVATVSASGEVTAVAVGTATITARSNDGEHTDETAVEVVDASSEAVVIEAETLDATGGAFDGFVVSETNINTNQTGDWADYNINFSEAGTYQVQVSLGSPAGGGIEAFINGASIGSATVPATGGWDSLQDITVSNALVVASPGTYTLRILSVGAPAAWQWNADKLMLRKLTDNVSGPVPSPLPSSEPSDQPTVEPSDEPVVEPSGEPSVEPSSDPLPEVDDIVLELESFIATGRDDPAIGGDDDQGFQVEDGIINFNTTGDWGDYSIDVETRGRYRAVLNYASGVPVDREIAVRLISGGNTIAETVLPSTGGWAAFVDFDIADGIEFDTAGTVSLRVQSYGANAWQWNADYIRFELVESFEPEPAPSPEASAEPSPEASAEPSPETSVEPAPETSAEPAPEPTPETSAEPAPETSVEPAPETSDEAEEEKGGGAFDPWQLLLMLGAGFIIAGRRVFK